MQRYRPHTFDTHGFFFGLKCLMVLALVLIGVRYGTAFASDRMVRDEAPASMAAAAESLSTPSLPLIAPEKAPAENTPLPVPPRVSAKSYIVADLESGTVLASKDSDTPYPIASVTKLLTALVARDVFTANTSISVTNADRAQTEGTPGSIQRNEAFAAHDLFYPLLMESNNSVAFAFARTFNTDEFIRRMLRKAHEIGMDSTLLNDPSGLSPNNTSTAHDLFALARHVYTTAPEFLTMTRTTTKAITAESGRAYAFANLNHFAGRDEFIGGKTGYTDEAHQTMVALFREDGHAIAIIVLHSDTRKEDVEKLLAWYQKTH